LLTQWKIDSISGNPSSVLSIRETVAQAERDFNRPAVDATERRFSTVP
jgi:hypothetical protein